MRSSRAGFTLIEVVIAIGVLAVIGILAFQTMASTLQARDWLEFQDDMDRSGRAAMERLQREFGLAYLTPNMAAQNSYRTVFVGKDDSDTDQAWFATRSHRRTKANSKESDQTEITIWCEPDPENRNRSVLLHRESQRIDQYPDKDGVIMPLARDVGRFDLRYLDSVNGEWQDQWDTQGAETPNRLPRAVQIVLTIVKEDPDDEDLLIERPYVATVMIEGAPPLQRSATASSGGASGGAGRLRNAGPGGIK